MDISPSVLSLEQPVIPTRLGLHTETQKQKTEFPQNSGCE